MEKELESKLRINFETALNNFNFSKVHNVMEFLDWRWYGEGVPSQIQMIETVKNLFNHALNENSVSTGTGGFYVELHKNEIVEIRFVLAESEYGYLDE